MFSETSGIGDYTRPAQSTNAEPEKDPCCIDEHYEEERKKDTTSAFDDFPPYDE